MKTLNDCSDIKINLSDLTLVSISWLAARAYAGSASAAVRRKWSEWRRARSGARGGPTAPQPIREENADSKSCEQQRRHADRESKGADVPSSKNSASSGPRSTQPLKTYPKVWLAEEGRLGKNLRCSLTWFCRLFAKNSLPVCIFWDHCSVKSQEKKRNERKTNNLKSSKVFFFFF